MKSVLVIDFNFEIRENTAELLSVSGFHVYKASNGEEGFRIAKNHIPDLIICDIMIPETDGITFYRLAKNDKETAGIPIIFFTASPIDQLRITKHVDTDNNLFLSKPFTKRSLINAVHTSLNIN